MDVFNSPGVVLGRDTVFGNDDRHASFLGGETNGVFERFRIKLVSHLRQLRSLRWGKRRSGNSGAGIGLYPDEIIAFCQFQPWNVDVGLFFGSTAVSSFGLIVLHR